MPIIDLPDDELAAVTAALRRVIEDDRYPRAPRLDPLRAALARLEAAATPEPTPAPTFRQSPSIPARTAFLMRWKNSQPW